MAKPSASSRTRASAADPAQLAVLAAQVAAPGERCLADVAERVALSVAEAEPADQRSEWAERFAAGIAETTFLPSVPTLANAGRGGQLAACFALELEDSLESIYGTLQRAARIQQGSGGVGIEFSALRPRDTPIERSGGRSPGPLAFAELFAHSARVMGLAGRRAGAHLAILRDDHPDILEFVRARRQDPSRFPQLGFAVGLSDALLEATRRGAAWPLRHATGGAGEIGARLLLEEIATSILETGDPTLLFVDRIEADNPTPSLGRLRATNPCGEQPLLPGESCVLGSIHLPAFVTPEGRLDEPRLARAVRDGVRFLDDALETNVWPDESITDAVRRTRKIGLGVMGLADLLLLHELPYASAAGRQLLDRVLGLVAREAEAASCALAEERGAFPAWERGPKRRHATTRAFAPTGTLRLLARCSPGIEPFLSPRIVLHTDGGELAWSDAWLVDWLQRRGVDPEPVLEALGEGAPAHALPGLSGSDRELLRRAWEIPAAEQIALQALAQRWVDGAVSKTVHLDPQRPPSPDALLALIEQARAAGCKGVAFYAAPRPRAAAEIDLRTRHPERCLHC